MHSVDMLVGWEAVPFAQALQPTPPLAGKKLLAREYRAQGLYPVIDQGQRAIAGWTDDRSLVIDFGLPYIVFGDHTRVFKFVEVPFVLGADGTQLLKPASEFDPRFFYYFCQSLEIPHRGYNRHFGLLKEREVLRPPIDEQRRIAAILWKVQRAIEVQEQLVATVRELKQAAMRQLFTRGLRGAAQKETPIGLVPTNWSPARICDIGEVITGTTPPTSRADFWIDGSIPFITPGDIGEKLELQAVDRRITEAGLTAARALPRGASLFVSIGSSIGKVGLTTFECSVTNQQVNAVVAKPSYDSLFVGYLLAYYRGFIATFASKSPVPIMSKGKFEQVELYISNDLSEQHEIATALATIDRKLAHHERKRDTLQELFKTLLHELMTGRIRVHELDIDITAVAGGPTGGEAT